MKNTINSKLDEYVSDPEKLNNLAKVSLDKFDEISSIAREKLEAHRSTGTGSVFVSSADAARANDSLRAISSSIQDEHLRLTQEPTIARVVIQHCETKEIQIFYVCRCSPPTGVKDVLSYRSPMGRLAALEVGGTYDLGDETDLQRYVGQDIFKVQHVTFRPIWKGESWDSRKTEYQDYEEKGIVTIDSLRKLLEGLPEDSEGILAAILANESKKENILQGIRCDIVETLSLRDQPILDQYQDDIFRLPLKYSLILLGPAGSGKTTTLIRRLGQKLDREQGLTR